MLDGAGPLGCGVIAQQSASSPETLNEVRHAHADAQNDVARHQRYQRFDQHFRLLFRNTLQCLSAEAFPTLVKIGDEVLRQPVARAFWPASWAPGLAWLEPVRWTL